MSINYSKLSIGTAIHRSRSGLFVGGRGTIEAAHGDGDTAQTYDVRFGDHIVSGVSPAEFTQPMSNGPYYVTAEILAAHASTRTRELAILAALLEAIAADCVANRDLNCPRLHANGQQFTIAAINLAMRLVRHAESILFRGAPFAESPYSEKAIGTLIWAIVTGRNKILENDDLQAELSSYLGEKFGSLQPDITDGRLDIIETPKYGEGDYEG